MATNAPAVELAITHQLGSLNLAADFHITAPWTVLFGPSGSGKSTILRTIAGLVRPDEGRVAVIGTTVADRKSGIWIPAHRRPIRWAGQAAALFPRKTVKWNVAAGMPYENDFRSKGWVDELDRALDVFSLRAIEYLHPAELSGGQKQLVSLTRAAIGARGRVLLLDEPFAGLDAAIRNAWIAGLHEWCPQTPIVSVTHDVGEAFLLAAEVIRIRAGRITAQGPAAEVLAEERARLQAMLVHRQ